jgi:hypothetical protein
MVIDVVICSKRGCATNNSPGRWFEKSARAGVAFAAALEQTEFLAPVDSSTAAVRLELVVNVCGDDLVPLIASAMFPAFCRLAMPSANVGWAASNCPLADERPADDRREGEYDPKVARVGAVLADALQQGHAPNQKERTHDEACPDRASRCDRTRMRREAARTEGGAMGRHIYNACPCAGRRAADRVAHPIREALACAI